MLEPTVDAPTAIDIDPEHCKMMGEFERLVKGAPSLRECSRLTVMSPVIFTEDDKLSGEVTLLQNSDSAPRRIGDL